MHPARSGCYRNSGLVGNVAPSVKIISTIRPTIYGTALYTSGGECALCQREGRVVSVLKVMLAASIVAIVALGTAAASASHYPRKLAPWSQLAQATETPRDETGGPAPAEVTTAVLEQQDVKSVLGRQVRSNVGEDMGRVVNVVVDRSGQVRAAIIDFGGFLGIGNRKIAIDWNALHHFATPEDDRITLDLTRDQVKAAPEYKDGGPLVVITTSD